MLDSSGNSRVLGSAGNLRDLDVPLPADSRRGGAGELEVEGGSVTAQGPEVDVNWRVK